MSSCMILHNLNKSDQYTNELLDIASLVQLCTSTIYTILLYIQCYAVTNWPCITKNGLVQKHK